MSSTELESEEAEHFYILPTVLLTPSLRSTYDLVKTKMSESEAEVKGQTNHNALSHIHFVISLVLLLLLVTPSTQFSLDHKQQSRIKAESEHCFHWIVKFYPSDYDSDSIASVKILYHLRSKFLNGRFYSRSNTLRGPH